MLTYLLQDRLDMLVLKNQYNFSQVFSVLTSNQELYGILRILKRIGQLVGQM